MGYKPTLGGLKRVQEFLDLKGHAMPIFQMDIYDDGYKADQRWMPGKGRTISINEAIRKYGAMYEMVDVRLANEEGDRFIHFSCISRVDIFTCAIAVENGQDGVLEYHKGDYRFQDFMDTGGGTTIVNLARWGKATVSILDRVKFRFFPKRYANQVFI